MTLKSNIKNRKRNSTAASGQITGPAASAAGLTLNSARNISPSLAINHHTHDAP
jgi:hypothetical protein